MGNAGYDCSLMAWRSKIRMLDRVVEVVEEERDEERHGARVEEGSTQRAKGKRRQSRYRVVGFATGEEINVSDEEETKMIRDAVRLGWPLGNCVGPRPRRRTTQFRIGTPTLPALSIY